MAKEELNLVANNILKKERTSVLELFSENIRTKINGFDDHVDELIQYVTGTFISTLYTGTGADYKIDNLKQVRFLPMAGCEVYTTDSKYFFSLLYCCEDDYDSKNVGLWNLMVQNCAYQESFVTYSSYDEWINGDKYRGITLI